MDTLGAEKKWNSVEAGKVGNVLKTPQVMGVGNRLTEFMRSVFFLNF